MVVMKMIFIEKELASHINLEYYVIGVFKCLHLFNQGLEFFIVMNYNT